MTYPVDSVLRIRTATRRTGSTAAPQKMPMHMRGSVYLTMLFFVAFMGVALAATSEVWSTQRQREREEALLSIGAEFAQAIKSYYLSSPGLVKTYPARLQDLLEDSRFLFKKRHLRQIYVDPMTGTRDWRLVMDVQGGIRGVSSTSEKAPIKTSNFEDPFAGFAGSKKYSEWVYGYTPEN